MNLFVSDDKEIMFLVCWDSEMCYTPSAYIISTIHLTLVWALSKINLFSERKHGFRKGLVKRIQTLFPQMWFGFVFPKCSFEAAQGYQNSVKNGDGADTKKKG